MPSSALTGNIVIAIKQSKKIRKQFFLYYGGFYCISSQNLILSFNSEGISR